MATKVDIKIPRTIWSAQDSMKLALNTLAMIKLRTSEGIDANGKAFKEYSQKTLYVSFKGARLKPKGGRKTKSGKSIYYKGGYQQYKHESRRRNKNADSAEVDLVLSGQLMNNLVVKEATPQGFRIGLTEHVSSYGYHVNAKREFLGLTPKDVEILLEAVNYDVRRKLGLE